MEYREFRGDTEVGTQYNDTPEKIEPKKTPPKKPDSLGKMAAKALTTTAVGFGLLGAALEQGQKEKEQRRTRIEELRKELAAEPEIPFVVAIDPNDPERAAKEQAMRSRIEKKVKLAELERITPEIK